ncbi:MAG: DUF6461 domain-containing protein [Propionibacteriales bacterium]|nr:DUF6461 domain-containing protein [Propionibacteriales bacterium]
MARTPSDYSWLTASHNSPFPVAGCVTVAVGTSMPALVQAFGGDSSQEVAFPDQGDGGTPAIASFGAGDNAAVILEVDGFEGSRPEVLKAASRKGKAASIFWNVNGVVVFSCARRGKVLCSFELLDDVPEELPRSLVSLAQTALSEGVDPVAIGAAMVEKFTGEPVSRTEVENAARGYPIVQRVVGLPVTSDELTALQLPSATTVSAVLAASPERRRRVAEWATERVIDMATLTQDDAVRTVLDQFGSGEVPALTVQATLLVSTTDQRCMAAAIRLASDGGPSEERDARYWGVRYWATQALLYATHPDDVTAVLGALYCGHVASGRSDKHLSDAVALLHD